MENILNGIRCTVYPCRARREIPHLGLGRHKSLAVGLEITLHLLGQLYVKPILEDLPDLFKWKPLYLRVKEDDKNPAKEADTCVEAERAARCHALHHREESRRDDEVAAPASDCIHHRAKRANLQWQKLCSDPADRGYASSEEGDVEDDGDKHDDTSPVDGIGLEDEIFGDGNPVECDGGDDHAHSLKRCQYRGFAENLSVSYHAQHSDQQNDAAPEFVYNNQVDECEEEVGSTNNDGNGGGLVEPDKGEQGRRVVHESVETTELRDCDIVSDKGSDP